MEKTPHVLLVGEGATQFAVEQGFTREELLTPESREAWQKWLQSSQGYKPVPNRENSLGTPGGPGNHVTFGMLALDQHVNLAGAGAAGGGAGGGRGRGGGGPGGGAGRGVD